MDIANINRVIEQVKAEPAMFKMSHWVSSAADPYNDSRSIVKQAADAPACGTAACLGGWMHILAMRDAKNGDGRYEDDDLYSYDRMLAKFLGIAPHNVQEIVPLFSIGVKPGEERVWMSTFDNELTPEERAAAGVRALELFRDTGEARVWGQALTETGLYDKVESGFVQI